MVMTWKKIKEVSLGSLYMKKHRRVSAVNEIPLQFPGSQTSLRLVWIFESHSRGIHKDPVFW